MALGNNIRDLRNAQGLTLEQLSELSNVEVGTISALENRDSKRTQYASAIARALGVSVEQLEQSPPSSEANRTSPASPPQSSVSSAVRALTEIARTLSDPDVKLLTQVARRMQTAELPPVESSTFQPSVPKVENHKA